MGWDHLKISELHSSVLADMQHEADETLSCVAKVKPTTRVRSIEHKMDRAIVEAWKKVANASVIEEVGNLLESNVINEEKISDMLTQIGIKLSEPLTSQQWEIIYERLKIIYTISKKEAVGKFKGKFVFGQPDELAVKASFKQQKMWIKDFYSSELSERISAVSRDVILESGLSHREAGNELMQALSKEFGLTPGNEKSIYAPEVPARYAANPEFYFQQVSSVAGHQARIFGEITGYEDSGVQTVELSNPMDERTGKICRMLNGQRFDLPAGLKQMRLLMDAEDPGEVRAVSSWVTPSALSNSLTGTSSGSQEATDALVGMGVLLPPFHPMCRTEILVVN